MLLTIMIIVDLERFTLKDKLVIYIGAFVELDNGRNRKQVHKIYGIIELEKRRISIAKNFCNLGAYRIIQTSSVLYNAHVVLKDQNKFGFYINNYIYWDQFNQLYDLN